MYYFYNVTKLEKMLSEDMLGVRGQSIMTDKMDTKKSQEIENLQGILRVCVFNV